MPMVRGGNEKRVNVFAGDDFAEVAVLLAVVILVVLVDPGARLFEMRGHHIADGHYLRVLLVEEVAHVPLSLRPHADAADDNAVARRDLARFAERGSGNQGRKSGGSQGQPGGLFQEITAGEEARFHIRCSLWR